MRLLYSVVNCPPSQGGADHDKGRPQGDHNHRHGPLVQLLGFIHHPTPSAKHATYAATVSTAATAASPTKNPFSSSMLFE